MKPWPADYLLQDRAQSAPQSSRLKAQSIHLNEHLNQPWSESGNSIECRHGYRIPNTPLLDLHM
jgi:hypothetical protein